MALKLEIHPEYSKLPESAIRAIFLGEVHYFTGKRCTKNHLSPRYASSGNCVQCIADKRGKVSINKSGKSSKRSLANHELAMKAHEAGKLIYESTDSCPAGHYQRYTSSNNCFQCSQASNEKRLKSARWRRIEKEYGLTQSEFDAMLSNQNHQCSICFSALHEKNTHIDHSHSTGKVRSLLCNKCNQAIGLLNEDTEILTSAINYLLKHKYATS